MILFQTRDDWEMPFRPTLSTLKIIIFQQISKCESCISFVYLLLINNWLLRRSLLFCWFFFSKSRPEWNSLNSKNMLKTHEGIVWLISDYMQKGQICRWFYRQKYAVGGIRLQRSCTKNTRLQSQWDLKVIRFVSEVYSL